MRYTFEPRACAYVSVSVALAGGRQGEGVLPTAAFSAH